MGKTVVLAGALDTKGAEFDYIRQVIQRTGLDVLTVDFGVLGEPAFIPDVGRAEVALASGGDLERWRSSSCGGSRTSDSQACRTSRPSAPPASNDCPPNARSAHR